MEKPLYLGFPILEMSKVLMYETFYDKLQTFLEEKYPVSLY